MNDPRQIERIFNEAMEAASDADRKHILDRACGSNFNLRNDVEALLAGNRNMPQDFLRPPLLFGPPRPEPGDTIDEFQIVRIVDEGGMGIVYEAAQKDLSNRKTALKVIRPGLNSEEMANRFHNEYHTLSRMNHPNIATIFGASQPGSERAYFAMEFVEGTSITKYCDEHRSSVETRLKLFAKVCDAIEHAHVKQVIHRDIKPTNILVTNDGNDGDVKVIDFGIAKAIDPDLLAEPVKTKIGLRVGSKDYMSPEQSEGRLNDIDVRSDIYSLGVVLFELLVGSRPTNHRSNPTATNEHSETEPAARTLPKPSDCLPTAPDRRLAIAKARNTTPRRLERQLRIDLDWIVQKALAESSDQRYQNARLLADDVRRYMAGEPVTAHPQSLRYSLWKAATKHYWLVTLAATVLGSTLVILIMGVNWAAAERMQHKAEGKFAQVQSETILQKNVLGQVEAELAETNASLSQRKDELACLTDLTNVHRWDSLAANLGPASSRNVPNFTKWIQVSQDLIHRKEEYDQSLELLRSRALPYKPEDHPLFGRLTAARHTKLEMEATRSKIAGQCRPVNTPLSSGPLYDRDRITHYFRHEFQLDRSYSGAVWRLQMTVDDGAAAYVNGKPVLVYNLPKEIITRDTVALKPIPGDGQETKHDLNVDESRLNEGLNVLAVELHQCTSDSPDAMFEAELSVSDTQGHSHVVVPRNAAWHYHDRGCDLPSNWAALDFRCVDWSNGKAPFGYNRLTDFNLRIEAIDAGIEELQKQVSTRHSWRFTNRNTQWWHDKMTETTEGLERLGQTAEKVKQRLKFAETVRSKTIEGDDVAEKWAKATRSIRSSTQCPYYNGLAMDPIEGLIPIGPDPHSGLWEFVHPETGTTPQRDATTGRLVPTESTGLVFVLIPGGRLFRGAEHPCGVVEETDRGLCVQGIPDDSFAYDIGLEAGDVIVEIRGNPVQKNDDLDASLSKLKTGERFELTVRRNQRLLKINGKVNGRVDCLAEADESPIRIIDMAPFLLSKYEMTQGQWLRVTGANLSGYPMGVLPDGRGSPATPCHPVESMAWEQCNRTLASLGLQLPTEAQLEYAVRAGTNTRWWTGSDRESLKGKENLDESFHHDGFTYHAPVGSFAPNPFGLHDAAGNVLEWCSDWFGLYTHPYGRHDGKIFVESLYRMARGGSYRHGPKSCRTTRRWPLLVIGNSNIGVRPARPLSP